MRIIFIVSLIATLGSLYVGYWGDPISNRSTGMWFNRLLGIPACDMCRYMRAFQYPITIISGIALLVKDTTYSFIYIGRLALGGMIIGLYKRALEYGLITESAICMSEVSCANTTNLGGFISLPLLGVASFGIILVSCFISRSLHNHHDK